MFIKENTLYQFLKKRKEYLHELYKPYNEKLYDFLGYEIDEWE